MCADEVSDVLNKGKGHSHSCSDFVIKLTVQGTLASRYQSAAAIIQQDPMTLYFHCAAHALNLCVVAACSVQIIRNMHGTLQELSTHLPRGKGSLKNK